MSNPLLAVAAMVTLARLAESAEDRADVFVLVDLTTKDLLRETRDATTLVAAGRLLRTLVPGGPVDWPAPEVARRLAASPPHARGFAVDWLDHVESHFTNRPYRCRWA